MDFFQTIYFFLFIFWICAIWACQLRHNETSNKLRQRVRIVVTQTRKHLQCSLHDLSRGSHSVASDSRWPLLDQRESHQTRVYILRSCALWALRLRPCRREEERQIRLLRLYRQQRKMPRTYARE